MINKSNNKTVVINQEAMITIPYREYKLLEQNQKDFNKIRVAYGGESGRDKLAWLDDTEVNKSIAESMNGLRGKVNSQDNFIALQRHNEIALRAEIAQLKEMLKGNKKSWWKL